jgi:hypothetical protein
MRPAFAAARIAVRACALMNGLASGVKNGLPNMPEGATCCATFDLP